MQNECRPEEILETDDMLEKLRKLDIAKKYFGYKHLTEYLQRDPTDLELGEEYERQFSHLTLHRRPHSYEEALAWKDVIRRAKAVGIDELQAMVEDHIESIDLQDSWVEEDLKGKSPEEIDKWFGYINSPTTPKSPVRYSCNCQEDLLCWIHSQTRIKGCQYILTSEKILEALAGCTVELVIHKPEWMSRPKKDWKRSQLNTWKTYNKWFPRIKDKEGNCGIYLLEEDYDEYGYPMIMHQKWLLGKRLLIEEWHPGNIKEELWEDNLVCGSFNLSKQASKHLESLFFLDNLEKLTNESCDSSTNGILEFSLNLEADFAFLKSQSIHWNSIGE